MNAYPQMLYREGFGIDWDGKSYETKVVDGPNAHAVAKAEGFVDASEVATLYQPVVSAPKAAPAGTKGGPAS